MTSLRAQVRAGYGVIPFTGSGISARSGIMMGVEFSDYIAWVIYRSVATDREQQKFAPQGRWNVGRQGWPPPPTPPETEAVRVWVKKEFEEICKRCKIAVGWTKDGRNVLNLFSRGRNTTVEAQMRRPLVPAILWSAETDVDDASITSFWQNIGNPYHFRELLSRPNLSPDSDEAITERAIRSLYRWNATLEFLAELALEDGDDEKTLYIIPRELSVIDSFNLHITQGKKPNLAHTMLCHLAETLRSRVVMTTNFDPLLEDAFAQLHEHYEVLSVSIHGQLPSYTTVHSLNCILKLHGTLIETRADFSLDAMPSLEDRERFFHYVCGHSPRKSARRESGPPLPLDRRNRAENHLLVLGYSGSDNRCVQLIKHVLDHSPRTKLFWVCFSENDLASLGKLFSENAYHQPADRLVVTATDRPDLLLLELYQNLNLCLPRGGYALQFNQHVPPKLWNVERDPEKRETVGDLGRVIVDAVERRFHEIMEARGKTGGETDAPPNLPSKPLVVEVEGRHDLEAGKVDVTGMMVVLRDAVEALKRRHFSTIWLEMEEFASVVQLAHEIFQVLAVRLGRFQLEHAISIPNRFVDWVARPEMWREKSADATSGETPAVVADAVPEPKPSEPSPESIGAMRQEWIRLIRNFVSYLGAQTQKTVIFCYGRNLPGMSSSWFGDPWGKYEYQSFWVFMQAMCEVGFIVVYSPYTEQRHTHDEENRVKFDSLAETIRKRCEKNSSRTFQGKESDEYKEFCELFNPFKNPLPGADTGVDVEYEKYSDKKREQPHMVRERPYVVVAHQPYRGTPVVETLTKMVDLPIRNAIDAYCSETSDKEKRRAALAELNFLYGISLFRRARHYSALLTEGVNPPPYIYNAKGLDNDWSRSQLADRWLREYRALSLIWRKPGGSAWLFRDTRLGLQQILQACHSIRQIARPSEESEAPEERWLAFTGQARARIHLWVARWNVRAFFSTGHVMPLLEALYHLFNCTETARFAAPTAPKKSTADETNTRAYRRMLWIKAMTLFVKILRLGRHTLVFWLDRSSAEAWLGRKARERLIQALETSRNRIFLNAEDASKIEEEENKNNRPFWEDLLNRLDRDDEKDGRSLRGIACYRHANRLILDLNGELTACWGVLDRQNMLPWFPKAVHKSPGNDATDSATEGAQSSDPFSDGMPPWNDYTAWEGWLGKMRYFERGDDWRDFDGNYGDYDKKDLEKSDLPLTWKERVGNGVVGVATRDGEDQKWNLEDWKKALKRFSSKADSANPFSWSKADEIKTTSAALRAALQKLIRNTSGILDAIHDLPRVGAAIGHLAYGHMRRAKVIDREYFAWTMAGRGSPDKALPFGSDCPIEWGLTLDHQESTALWLQTAVLCRCVLEYCSYMPPAMLEYDLSIQVSAITNHGLASGHVGRYFEAHRRLNEADAFLSKLPRRVDSTELAVVRLRQAEIHLQEGEFLERLRILLQEAEEVAPLWEKYHKVREKRRQAEPNHEEIMTEVLQDVEIRKKVSPGNEAKRKFLFESPAVNFLKGGPVKSRSEKGIDTVFQQWFAYYQIPNFSVSEGSGAAQQHLERISRARIDDAWASIESAERLLSGRTRTSQWWGRLCTLKLRVFGRYRRNCAFRLLAFRRQIDYAEELTRVFRLGLSVWPDDPYRRIRLGECFLEAWARVNLPPKGKSVADLSTEGKRLVRQALEDDGGYHFQESDSPKRYSLLIDYRYHVITRLLATWPQGLGKAPILKTGWTP